jgi:hypothetical protein
MLLKRLIPLAILVAAAVTVWNRLEPGERTYLRSILRQLPELPGRYAV